MSSEHFHRTLPRLAPEAYVGHKHAHLVPKILDRRRVLINRPCVDPLIAELEPALRAYGCECVVYVFMPDHAHFILHGLTETSNVLECHNHWKGVTARWLCERFKYDHIWQERSYDHVFRSYEYERHALAKTLNYIVLNPVRAGLVETWQAYPYLGSMIGPHDIRHPYWWDWFDSGDKCGPDHERQ